MEIETQAFLYEEDLKQIIIEHFENKGHKVKNTDFTFDNLEKGQAISIQLENIEPIIYRGGGGTCG